MASLAIVNGGAATSALFCKCKERNFYTGERLLEFRNKIGNGSGSLRWCRQSQQVCSMRASQSRGPLWRGRVLNNDTIQAVQALKRAKGDDQKIERVFETRVSRLVKADLLAVLQELKRQDECDLALRVFDVVRKEIWYKPDLSLYDSMIMALKRNDLIQKVDPLFAELKKECLQPDTKAFTRLVATFLRVGLPQHAIEAYELMKQTGSKLDEYTFAVLIKGLQRLREPDLAAAVTKDYKQFLNGSMEFLKDSAQDVVKS